MSTVPRMRAFFALLLTLLGLEACAVTTVLVPHPTTRLIEVKSATPGIDYHWVTGHYRWHETLRAYTWVGGRWERILPGHRWLSGRYGTYTLGAVEVKQWNPGRWVPQRRSADHRDGNTSGRNAAKEAPKGERGSIQQTP
jgi:hypothetical protein